MRELNNLEVNSISGGTTIAQLRSEGFTISDGSIYKNGVFIDTLSDYGINSTTGPGSISSDQRPVIPYGQSNPPATNISTAPTGGEGIGPGFSGSLPGAGAGINWDYGGGSNLLKKY